LKGCYEDLGGLGVQNEEEREKKEKKSPSAPYWRFIGHIRRSGMESHQDDSNSKNLGEHIEHLYFFV
jgi:6-phosphofructokinase